MLPTISGNLLLGRSKPRAAIGQSFGRACRRDTHQHHSAPIRRQEALQSADVIVIRPFSRERSDHFGPHRESEIVLFMYYAA